MGTHKGTMSHRAGPLNALCRVRRATTMPNVTPFSCLSQTPLFSDIFGDDLGTLQTNPRAFSQSRESQAKMCAHTVAATDDAVPVRTGTGRRRHAHRVAATDDATYVRTRTHRLLANVCAFILFFSRAMLNAGRPALFLRQVHAHRQPTTPRNDATHTQTGRTLPHCPHLSQALHRTHTQADIATWAHTYGTMPHRLHPPQAREALHRGSLHSFRPSPSSLP
jgi:hypothetical protein